MSLVLEFDKLWKIVDDCIETGRYKQILHSITNNNNGRCINGLFISYAIGHNNPKNLGYDDKSYEKYIDELHGVFNNTLYPKYKLSLFSDEVFDFCNKEKDNNKIIEKLKQDYSEKGIIDNSYLASLNNNGMSFEDIRDLLKEMDV